MEQKKRGGAISAPHICEEANKTDMTEWLDGPLGLWELCLCDEQTHMALLAVFARCLPPTARSANAQNCHTGLHLAESLSLSQTKPAKDKGAVLVARRPLAFVLLDAPRGSAAA